MLYFPKRNMINEFYSNIYKEEKLYLLPILKNDQIFIYSKNFYEDKTEK